jgi:segregation and condensation protein B
MSEESHELPENPEPEEAESVSAVEAAPEPAFPLHRIVEAILFASQKPVSAKELSNFLKGAAEAAKEDPSIACFAKVKAPQLQDAIEQLEREFAETGRAFEIRESAAGWQLVTKADFAPWLRQLFPENRQARLSAPAMETLAIIAYRQPITRADIEAVRGVAVDGVMQTLLDRNLVRIAGRADIAGRPLLYETTQFFMEHFGLKNLDDLPNASELRKIPLPKAEPPAEEPKESPAEAPQETLSEVPAETATPSEEP